MLPIDAHDTLKPDRLTAAALRAADWCLAFGIVGLFTLAGIGG